MKELENKKELMEAEEEKVAGGKISPICLRRTARRRCNRRLVKKTK